MLGLGVLAPGLARAQTVTPSQTGAAKTERIIVRAAGAPGAGWIAREKAAVSRSTVSAEAIAKQPATSNAFELLRLAPGANVSTSDAYGLSPSVNISVRGLNGDEIAYLVEGAPVNDIGYYAGYPSQWVDAENIRTARLQQGTVDLDTPTVNAGGGLIAINLRDPLDQAGGTIEGSAGSYHMNREFIRLDTGLLGDTGVKGFVSFSNTQADNDRGPGHDQRQHVDFKFTKDWGDGNHVAVAGSYHDAILSSYPMPTLSAWQQYGRSYNYDGTFSPFDTNYWKLYAQTWRDEQLSAPSHFTLSDQLAFEVTPYWEHGFGNSPYGTVLPTSGLYQGTQKAGPVTIPNASGGQGLVLADYIGNQYRAGQTSEFIVTAGANRLTAGWWYDYADDYDPQPFTPVGLDGDPASAWGFPDTIKLPNGQNLSAQEAHTREQANVLFLGDTLTLLDGRLILEAGLKYAMVNREGTNGLPGPQYRVGLDSAEPLPRASARYQITPESEIFASVSTNFRSPTEYVLYNSYDVTSGQILTQGTSQRDEYSIAEELGYRYQGSWITGSVTFFNYNFTNRQVSTLIDGVIGSSINAGGQTSRGVDAEIGLTVLRHLRPYLSAEYLHATIDNNFAVDGDYLPTAGKIAVRSPAFQGAVGLDYDDGRYFSNASVKYVGSQYATFLDDERIPSHAQADAALGVRLPDYSYLKQPEARLNFVNVTDAKFLSGVAAVEPNAQAAVGIYGTKLAGTAPTYYIGPGFAVILTLASSF